jgi:hypothetical protein
MLGGDRQAAPFPVQHLDMKEGSANADLFA